MEQASQIWIPSKDSLHAIDSKISQQFAADREEVCMYADSQYTDR